MVVIEDKLNDWGIGLLRLGLEVMDEVNFLGR